MRYYLLLIISCLLVWRLVEAVRTKDKKGIVFYVVLVVLLLFILLFPSSNPVI